MNLDCELKVRALSISRQIRACQQATEVCVEIEGHSYLNFCSNDYLGLANHPHLKAKAISYISQYGVGAGASRLVCGTHEYHQATERRLASLLGKPEALIFPSAFQANIGVLSCLADRSTEVFVDRLCHNSLFKGILLSRAKCIRFHHNNFDHLEKLLQQSAAHKKIIVTESLFSMEGNLTDLNHLVKLAKAYRALLYVDDAHAFGVLGPRGMGLAACHPDIDIIVGGFGKAAGCAGGYVACSKPLKEYLINFCSSLIYSTAVSPALIGAIEGALDQILQMDRERSILAFQAGELRNELSNRGFNIGNSKTHLIPMIVGSEEKTLCLASYLQSKGILAVPIRPPTVPLNTSRIRLALCTLHNPMHLNTLLSALDSSTV